ncbi:MAG: ATP-binding cassette domain-containing protein [Planctomycetota bacterium]|nr:MAG: ATP-binding cassette domain-containing protein [Planctomycetota bacterium]
MILNDVWKSFGQRQVVQAIDLHLQRGKTYALIGPSGCGKTTLLKLMIGLTWPDRGTISLDGMTLNRENVRQWRMRFGYVIQQGGLFPHLTAWKNVTLMAEVLKRPPDKIRQRVAELAQLADMNEETLTRYPIQLSGGQRQRVSLMRALMLDPEFLLFDEPLSALDPMIRAELRQQLKHMFATLHKTVVWVTHDLYEARYFADEIILIHGGRVEQRGSPEELIRNPATPFAQEFVSAQLSLVEKA